jgi:hypothetical protein
VFLPYGHFITVGEGWERDPSLWRGLIPDIFHSIRAGLNFTFALALSRDGKWGSRDSEGRWSGIIRCIQQRFHSAALIRDLVEGEADIAVAALAVTQARWVRQGSDQGPGGQARGLESGQRPGVRPPQVQGRGLHDPLLPRSIRLLCEHGG